MNIGAPCPDSVEAWWRVRKMQTKLHQWALDDPNRRFKDLYNLVCDPAFLVVAWERVKGNRGARSAGVDGGSPAPSFSAATSSSPGFETISRPGASCPSPCGNGSYRRKE